MTPSLNEENPLLVILLFVLAGIGAILGGMIVSWILRPNRPNPEKNTTYECGEDTLGSAWIQFNIRFYVIALIFLIFDVEIIFLFPWATVLGNADMARDAHAWPIMAFLEIVFFTIVLLAGLIYLWANGDLGWVKPTPILPNAPQQVPNDIYAKINEQYAGSKAPVIQ